MKTLWRSPHVLRTMVLSGLLLLTFGIMVWILEPLHGLLFPETEVNALLVYLPHGIRVIAAWLFGWKSILYLLPANMINFVLIDLTNLRATVPMLMFIVAMVSPPVAFQALAFVGFDLRKNPALRFNWRSVVFAGAIASLVNALTLHVLLFNDIASEEHLIGIAYWIIGDSIGVIVVLLSLLTMDRWMRRILK